MKPIKSLLLAAALIPLALQTLDAQQYRCFNGQCYQVQPARTFYSTPIRSTVHAVLPPYQVLRSQPVIAAASGVDIAFEISEEEVIESVNQAQALYQGILPNEAGRRLTARQHLKRMYRRADGVQAAKIKKILEDDDLFAMYYAEASAGFVSKYGADGQFLDAVKEFLQFLLDNQDKIISLIERLIQLFGEAPAVSYSAVPYATAYAIPEASSVVYDSAPIVSYASSGCTCVNCTCSSYTYNANGVEQVFSRVPARLDGSFFDASVVARQGLFTRWRAARQMRREGRMQRRATYAQTGEGSFGLAVVDAFMPNAWFNVGASY